MYSFKLIFLFQQITSLAIFFGSSVVEIFPKFLDRSEKKKICDGKGVTYASFVPFAMDMSVYLENINEILRAFIICLRRSLLKRQKSFSGGCFHIPVLVSSNFVKKVNNCFLFANFKFYHLQNSQCICIIENYSCLLKMVHYLIMYKCERFFCCKNVQNPRKNIKVLFANYSIDCCTNVLISGRLRHFWIRVLLPKILSV